MECELKNDAIFFYLACDRLKQKIENIISDSKIC